ncbi:MAG: L,D-transpeptidase [Bacteroidales bacterium]|nr:L,D-transpeptidase [Bacteroidales bacterium]
MVKIGSVIGILAVLTFLGLYFTGLIFAPHVPETEAHFMEKSIAFARKQGAERFAGDEFAECIALRNKTLKEWRLQNNLWIIRRDYSKTSELIKLTTAKAVSAGKKAVEKSGNMKKFVETTLKELKERDQYFNDKFRVLPLEKELYKSFSVAHMLMQEALESYSRGDLNSAYAKLGVAEGDFSDLENQVKKKLADYFESFPRWEKWYKQTLELSRQNKTYAVLVDKMAHECILLKDGKIVNRYPAELSLNWIGHKKLQGDNATPEGVYKIVKKINRKETKYYKALLLNYPNETDKVQFAEEIRSGALEPSARIGGLIEIHGEGGIGKDWTEGCVALENKDIDALFAKVGVGTAVTIVGSLVPLSDLFD